MRVLELGLFASREAAQAAIMDGGIVVDGKAVTKPGASVSREARIELAPGWGKPKYVSRGGLKLEKALDVFGIDPEGRICLDIGASTGGFTDCLLKHGAQLVYAVDVGYGQLDWSLRNDPRVVVVERVNARNLTAEFLYSAAGYWADLAVIDVSFISVVKILPACLRVLRKPAADFICLIKPQFEAGRALVGKGGVVKSAAVHTEVIQSLRAKGEELGLHMHRLTCSPIKGPAGNIEFLAYWRTDTASKSVDIAAIVDEAHQLLR